MSWPGKPNGRPYASAYANLLLHGTAQILPCQVAIIAYCLCALGRSRLAIGLLWAPFVIPERIEEMSKRKYFVTVEEDCSQCDGVGVVQHPAWAQYWNEFGGPENHEPETRKEILDWFYDNGWSFELRNGHLPSEEEPCSECEGAGVVVRRVQLADALEDIFQPGEEITEFLARMMAKENAR